MDIKWRDEIWAGNERKNIRPFVLEVLELKVVISRFAVQAAAAEESFLEKAIESNDWESWKKKEG